MKIQNNLLESAYNYKNQKLQVIPLIKNTKKPAIRFKELSRCNTPPLTDKELEYYFSKNNYNIGILAGLSSNNFFVLDFDKMPVYNNYKNPLSHITCKTPVIKTKRGCHIYLKTTNTIFSNPFKPIPGLDFKYNGYVVSPYSTIEDFTYQFQLFSESIYQLESFDELPFIRSEITDKEIYNPPPEYFTIYGISYDRFKILKGDKKHYESRSEAEYSLIVELVNKGYSLDQIFEIFNLHAIPETHFNEHKNKRRWIVNGYYKAIEYLTKNRRDIDKKIDQLYQFSNNINNFFGKTKYTDQAVFQAILQIANRTGKIQQIGASIREIAELAGINRNTAYKALNRIKYLDKIDIEVDILPQIGHSYTRGVYRNGIFMTKSIKPNLYNIKIPENIQDHIKSIGETAKKLRIIGHDLFRFSGLNKTGLRIYNLLQNQNLSIDQIITLSGISQRTVYRKLEIMSEIGLIVKIKDYYCLINCNLDELARKLNVEGIGNKQRQWHRQERQANYERIDQHKNKVVKLKTG